MKLAVFLLISNVVFLLPDVVSSQEHRLDVPPPSTTQDAQQQDPVDPEELFHNAMRLMEQGELEKAKEQFDLVIKENSLYRLAYARRAQCHRRLNKVDEALKDFQKAIDMSVEYPWVYLERGSIYMSLKRFEEALEDFDDAIRFARFSNMRRQDRSVYYQSRADVRLRLHQDEAALQDYRQALRYNPANFGAVNNASWLLSTSPNDSIRNGEIAVALTNSLLQHDPDNPILLDTYSVALAETGEFEQAIEALTRAMKIRKEDADYLAKANARLELFKALQPYRDDRSNEQSNVDEQADPEKSDPEKSKGKSSRGK